MGGVVNLPVPAAGGGSIVWDLARLSEAYGPSIADDTSGGAILYWARSDFDERLARFEFGSTPGCWP